MNTICNTQKVSKYIWLVEVQTPDGALMRVNHCGTREEAEEKARWAEAEPA